MTTDIKSRQPRPVAVVVPVYGNLEVTRRCIESLIASALPEHASITVIDDHSPDEAVSAYCREVAGRTGISLVVNDDNLGFVVTANKGFSCEPDADIILLNSDTVVASDWIQRLQDCAYREEDTGTVTPFSNNGTICSYPVFLASNALPEQWTVAELDSAFASANREKSGEIPTAVGFCMYIKRSCLNETGSFDEKNFGHGYGEECDFSIRASASGWKHKIAADVFVYHEGAASFAGESTERKRRADTIMSELHPHYDELVSDFIQQDPLYNLRKNVDAARLAEKPWDSGSILEEHSAYTKTILARAGVDRSALIRAHEQQQKLEKQQQELEKMLVECRRQFTETDTALTDAQAIVAGQQEAIYGLNEALEQSQIYSQQLHDRIRDLEQTIAAMDQTIRSMEQSRSWRYTAWLRK